ncbi:MAG: DNA-binding protein [Planctomycetota bacterium]|nr:MAG: DNA-binding protein [Planctomycetota bacterium]
MASGNDDFHDIAQQFQQAADSGGFDPLSLLTGDNYFHSVFLAPFAPSMQKAIAAFLDDGRGPLQHLTDQFRSSGLSAAEAAMRARGMLEHAQGMCVIVQENDQGLNTIPQLFFGHIDDTFIDHAVLTCGEQFSHAQTLRRCLKNLARSLKPETPSYKCFALAQGSATPAAYWFDLAERLIGGLDDGVLPNLNARLRDLSFWIIHALSQRQEQENDWDGDALMLLSRLAMVAGDHQHVGRWMARMLADYEPEDEALLQALEQWAQEAITTGQPHLLSDFLAQQAEAINQILGGIYELELLRFKILAAGQASADDLLAQSDAMQRADRKSFRHDLGREPLWQVTIADPGPSIDVAEAADILDRSINFVAKRLDNRTIPHAWRGDELVIPRQALAAWKAVMDHHRLID